MQVKLSELHDNPFRDFEVDPIVEANVDKLLESINEHDFWGGVTARKVGDKFEIAAGHHRVRAAIRKGIEKADIFVGDFDDDQMVAIYATENATQRGNEGAASLGSIAAAIKRTAQVLSQKHCFDPSSVFMKEVFKNRAGFGHARAHFLSETGIGRDNLDRFFKWKRVPDITRGVIERQLVTLKASGDYTRIITNVQRDAVKESEVADAEVEEADKEVDAAVRASNPTRKRKARVRQKEATEKRERVRAKVHGASTAAESAAKIKVTLDTKGIRKHLPKDEMMQAFQDIITRPSIRDLLPFEGQEPLAKHLADSAKEANVRLTTTFVRDHTFALAKQAIGQQQASDRKEKLAKAQAEEAEVQIKRCVQGFSQGVRTASGFMQRLYNMSLDNDGNPTHDVLEQMHSMRTPNLKQHFIDALASMEGMLQWAKEMGFTFGKGDRANVLDLDAVRKQPRKLLTGRVL